MSGIRLEAEELSRLARFASILIPGNEQMPAAGKLAGYEARIEAAVAACGHSDSDLSDAISRVATVGDWAGAQQLASSNSRQFFMMSTLVSVAYFMHPTILEQLGYPVERQHPAEVEDFLHEYETGILDPVVEAAPRYRDAAPKSGDE